MSMCIGDQPGDVAGEIRMGLENYRQEFGDGRPHLLTYTADFC